MTVDNAVVRARIRQTEIVASIRQKGFKDGGATFTDAQIWQAAVDCKSGHPDTVAVHLLTLVIDGDPVPSSPTYDQGGDDA